MKKRNLINQDFIIVGVFVFFLVAPSIFYFFLTNQMDHTNYENRELYTKPVLSLKNVKTYASDYENYFNDHLPFKNKILKFRATLLYHLFQTSASEKVIVGKNGWFFYNSVVTESPNNSIQDYQKINSYSEQEMLNIKNVIDSDIQKFNENGIDYYILVGPNKEIIYEDYMPNTIKRNKKYQVSRTEQLVDFLKDDGKVKIVYPKTLLIENRKVEDTYFKYDTHWNDYGAYLGAMEVLKLMGKNETESKIKFGKQLTVGDLAVMNLMSSSLMNKEPVILNFHDNVIYTCKEDTEFKNCVSENAKYDETILIVGDSFRNSMAPYFAKLFKHAIIVHRNYYTPTMIDKYHPDLIVNVTVERGSSILQYPLNY